MRKCVYRVSVDGSDITSRVAPRLVRMTISDKEGLASDTAEIELDDTDGILRFPRAGAKIEIGFGWEHEGGPQTRFRGVVDEPRSSGGRGDGRKMTISAKGIDTKSKQKEEKSKHWDDKTLGDVLKEAGKAAGISDVKIDSKLAGIKRKYWDQHNESFIQLGQRLAEEVGGTFKIQGGKAIMAKRGSGTSPLGGALTGITAAWGRNLISWDISPSIGRPDFEQVRFRFYDRKEGKWKEKKAQVRGGTSATKTVRSPAVDEDDAKTKGEADAGESERNRGGGTVRIDGNGNAQPEATLTVSGARPGVDGTYTITDVEHEISCSGWETNLTVKKPGGSAGKDTRGQ